MDQILHRMTDFPSKSQPAEYIHLAVIRETSITHRQTHYHYFSYDHHQALVKEGLAVEPWAPKTKKKGIKTGSLAEAEGQPQVIRIQELDEYGFPPLDATRLLKKDGSSSLADSALVGKKKENVAAIQGKPGWKKGAGKCIHRTAWKFRIDLISSYGKTPQVCARSGALPFSEETQGQCGSGPIKATIGRHPRC
jgi:hypothetical protein